MWEAVKQFLTEYNLQRELSALSAGPSTMPSQVMVTSVVEMNEKKLTIDLKPAKQRAKNRSNKKEEEEEDEFDSPSSADIQVVHKHPIPNNLHSILKQRTVSESSEDFSHSQEDPSSPRTEDDDSLHSAFSKKRSVSFNSYVDQASFKSSASPSSMTPALKSKRRKQRKHQQRLQNGRNRRNSGGTSSSEECLQVSDSLSHSEEEMEGGEGRAKVKVLTRAASDPGPDTESSGDERVGSALVDESCPEVTKSHSLEGANSGGEGDSSGSIASVHHGLDFRTNGSGQGGDRGKAKSDTGRSASGPTEEQERNKRLVTQIKTKLSEKDTGGGDGKSTEDDSDDDDDDFVDAVSSIAEEVSTKVSVGDSGEPQGREKSDVETMLSWEEQPQTNGGEHSTQCAFTFSNSVMFDLDVD